ncbi:FAD-binding protein [Halobellus captivus]|uniref:FAD-binding protein n=1 Tax=Halobellus captivus TaxID=2592614 RepID=UPI0011A12265|nr:FAD-binding protein [Halobellus captivus]
MDFDADVVVVGGGIAGLVSTLRSLEYSENVVLLEKAPTLGGTLPVTGGTFAVEKNKDPAIDVFEPVETGIEWLRDHGISVNDPDDRWLTDDAERIGRIDTLQFIDEMAALIEENGGEIHRETAFKRLKLDDEDEISGVVAHNENGKFEINAASVILATGGFSGNADLIEQYFPHSNIWNGRHPWSTGEGFIAARNIGAKTTRGLSNALGGVRPAPPAQITDDNRRDTSTVYRDQTVILNADGIRFTDESKAVSGSTGLVSQFLNNVEEDGYLVLDHDIYESHTDQMAFSPKIGTLVEGARDAGAPVVEAETLEELGNGLDELGADGYQAVETIRTFNAAVRGESDERLRPPREDNRYAIDEPPFYAIAVQPTIVYIRGGLDINHNAEVVSQQRSTTGLEYVPTDMTQISIEPIPGLYAAGIEVGRSEDHSYYHLGLSLGLATGRTAGKHAAKRAKAKQGEQPPAGTS